MRCCSAKTEPEKARSLVEVLGGQRMATGGEVRVEGAVPDDPQGNIEPSHLRFAG
jgi:ABC-type uncharacterized transport system ATPase subunit